MQLLAANCLGSFGLKCHSQFEATRLQNITQIARRIKTSTLFRPRDELEKFSTITFATVQKRLLMKDAVMFLSYRTSLDIYTGQ